MIEYHAYFGKGRKRDKEKDDEFCPIAKLLEKKRLRCRWVKECKRLDKGNYKSCKIKKREPRPIKKGMIKFKILKFIRKQKKPITIKEISKGIGKDYYSVKNPFKDLLYAKEIIMVNPKSRNEKGIFEPALYRVPKKDEEVK